MKNKKTTGKEWFIGKEWVIMILFVIGAFAILFLVQYEPPQEIIISTTPTAVTRFCEGEALQSKLGIKTFMADCEYDFVEEINETFMRCTMGSIREKDGFSCDLSYLFQAHNLTSGIGRDVPAYTIVNCEARTQKIDTLVQICLRKLPIEIRDELVVYTSIRTDG